MSRTWHYIEQVEDGVDKVTFMEHVITKYGLKIDQQKIEAIEYYETPKDVKAVRRLLGMCNYKYTYPGLSQTILI